MALTDSYVEVEDFKERIGVTASTSDDTIENVIAAASRQIDGWCGRSFANTGDTPVLRYFTARDYDRIAVGDVIAVTELATDASGGRTYTSVWTSDDFDLYPYDAEELGRPYHQIRTAFGGTWSFPVFPRGVRVTARWGWPSVPDAIREATFLQANRLFARTKAPFGITGAPNELGQQTAITSLDPDVRTMIAPYKVLTV